MKILITGARGFTGRFFQVQAQESGHEIVPLQADLTDSAALSLEVAEAEADAIVHLAAISFVGHADLSAFYNINVLGTTNLLDAVLRAPKPPHRVLLASSANVYGNSADSPLSEAHAPNPVNHYAASKLAMEQMAKTYADRVNLIITRPFNYTGPGQDENFIIPKLVKHFLKRLPSVELGNLNVEREFNDVRFVCDAYLKLLVHGDAGQIYNVCSGKPYSLNQIIGHLTQVTGHHISLEINPAFVRRNEVFSLYGDPSKLADLMQKKKQSLFRPSLEETLSRMLNEGM